MGLSGYDQISGFRFLSESNENGVEVHFEGDFSPFRIHTLVCPAHVSIWQLSLERIMASSMKEHSLTGNCSILILKYMCTTIRN